MTTKNLIESGNVLSEDPNEDGAWRVRLINEGQGSSGYYSADLIENYHSAFDGVISFLNHPVGGPETRNFTEIAGRVVGETWVDTAEDGTKGVYANWKPDPDYKNKLETYRDQLGLSIYISGSGEVDEDGVFHVKEFDREDPFRSVDVVIAAGRGGRFELTESVKQIYESRRSGSENSSGARQEETGKEIKMDELKAALEALTVQVSALVSEKKNAEAAEAQVEADEAAVTSAIESYASRIEAIDKAELLPVQVESLRARAAKGEDVTEAIAEAKAIKEAAFASLSESQDAAPGRIVESRKVESAVDLGKVFG